MARRGRPGRERLQRWAHLAALWTLAVAQPLLDLLGRHPEFFVRRGTSGAQIVGFAVLVAIAPALGMAALELALGQVSAALERALHLFLVGVLVAAVAVNLTDPGAVALAASVTILAGGAAVVAYARLPYFRSALTLLAPAPLVFVLVFLFASDATGLVFPGDRGSQSSDAASTVPVVLVIFDEFPVNSLMDSRGAIDRRLYPNFARLAGDSTWYRNTASVDQDTPYALPAILDGRLPRRDRLPVAADHPQNIFTLLHPTHALHVREDATAICPPTLCLPVLNGDPRHSLWHESALLYTHLVLPPPATSRLPAVESAWRRLGTPSGSGMAILATKRTPRETKQHRYRRLHANLASDRPARFANFVSGIEGGHRPYLHLIHILLPHVPYQYLPSGRAYRRQPNEAVPGLDSRPGFGVPFLVRQAYQRHLLQVGATDRLLGRLLDRLQRVGIYDRALVAVTADHGISFRLGHDRRLVRPQNVRDIAPVPLFIKAPGQTRGRVSDKPLRTIDVLPTIADLMGVKIPWRVDGRSALVPTVAAQRRRTIISKKFRHTYLVDTPGYRSDRAGTLARKLRLFGTAPSRFGPRGDLLGRAARAVPTAPVRQRAHIVGAPDYRQVNRDGGVVPVHVVGSIVGGTPGGGRVVALAVNGRVAASGLTFSLAGTQDEQFSFMLPEAALAQGSDRLEVLLVRRSGWVSLGGIPRSGP